jgi:hypothetical protein
MLATAPDLLKGLLTLGGTVDQSLSKSAHAGASQHLVSVLGRGAVVVIVLAGIAGFARRMRRGSWDASSGVLAVAPVLMLAGGAYGGEIIFRIYLFALPFLALLAGALCYPSPSTRRVASAALMLVVSAAMLTGFLFGYFGKEEWTHFSLGELRAAELVFAGAQPHTLVVDATPDYPIGFANFENITFVHFSSEPRDSIAAIIASPEPELHAWLGEAPYAHAYLIITRSQKAECDALGILPHGELDRIEQALLRSPRFAVVYRDTDAAVFTVRSLGAKTKAGT